MDVEDSFMLYNGIPFTSRVSDNYSVWWIPKVTCMKEMLLASLFEPVDESISIVEFTSPLLSKLSRFPKQTHNGTAEKEYRVGRLCMTARAVASSEVNSEFLREMNRGFRNPGLDLLHT
jgi:hypothetical protein